MRVGGAWRWAGPGGGSFAWRQRGERARAVLRRCGGQRAATVGEGTSEPSVSPSEAPPTDTQVRARVKPTLLRASRAPSCSSPPRRRWQVVCRRRFGDCQTRPARERMPVVGVLALLASVSSLRAPAPRLRLRGGVKRCAGARRL